MVVILSALRGNFVTPITTIATRAPRAPEEGRALPVDRLSALDESFLRLETDSAPMHVGWTLVLDGEAPSVRELRDHIAGRLGLLPRFRRRVVTSRLHNPLWVDDARFSLADHISRV